VRCPARIQDISAEQRVYYDEQQVVRVSSADANHSV